MPQSFSQIREQPDESSLPDQATPIALTTSWAPAPTEIPKDEDPGRATGNAHRETAQFNAVVSARPTRPHTHAPPAPAVQIQRSAVLLSLKVTVPVGEKKESPDAQSSGAPSNPRTPKNSETPALSNRRRLNDFRAPWPGRPTAPGGSCLANRKLPDGGWLTFILPDGGCLASRLDWGEDPGYCVQVVLVVTIIGCSVELGRLLKTKSLGSNATHAKTFPPRKAP